MLVSSISGSGTIGVPASSTWFYDIIGLNIGAVEAVRQAVLPQAGTFRAFYVQTNTAQPATGSLVLTINIGGVPQALQVTIPAGSPAGVYSDTAHSVVFAAGNLIDISANNSATSSSTVIQTVSFVY